jgi:archaellum component FlaG (FlaF/FlaG flagellin family)
MKFFRSISLIALVLACALASSAQQKQPKSSDTQSTETGPQPQLVIESLTHDFGELKSGTPLRYAFKIKNTGKADLIIESVSPG